MIAMPNVGLGGDPTGVEQLRGCGGLPFGLDPLSRPEVVSAEVTEHSSLIAFTDGLVEQRGEHLDVSLDRKSVV